MKLRSALFFSALIVLISCTEEKHRGSSVAASKVKNVKLEFTNADHSKIAFGDTLQIALSFESDIPVHEVILESESGTLSPLRVDSLLFTVSTASIGGGYHNIRARVILEDSTAMRGSASLRVLRESAPSVWKYRLIETYPHDRSAYTQGLLYANGWLYESAGRYGLSDIRIVDWRTGSVKKREQVEDEYFAEGLTLYRNELYQLTWRENKVFVYSAESLMRERTFSVAIGNGEGWGLCSMDSVFVVSDGSADLFFVDPDTWESIHHVRVFDHQGDVRNLNELEYVGGKIYANILHEDRIAVIDPQSGMVQAYWDLSDILSTQDNVGRVDVMNGIAYCPDRSSFFITGKLWPYLFEVTPVFQ